ncbi:zinc ribbon domain-containing protein [Gimesia fumaroli]|uniref:Zinc finger/thioredoxin putative domain-containing protein n=1 Tax=Gimesia fumaroli TaxID=2527976 RepID=A0A518IKD0_9PLAN|nr:hypothetical protein [Gimesia fumaroli]QDV53561.1 hypothetical protein Enr17x_56410 [Gimesia fumaroli]
MTSIAVPCPQCKKKLKLRDKSLLGKKARCPNCKHAFVLKLPITKPAIPETVEAAPSEQVQTNPAHPQTPPQSENEEVKIELAQPATPVVGTSAKWIPDEPVAPQPAAFTPPVEKPDTFAQIDTTSPGDSKPVKPAATVINTDASDPAVPNIALESTDHAGVARLRELRRKNAKRRNMSILIGLALILVIGVGAFFAWSRVEQTITAKPPTPTQRNSVPAKPVLPPAQMSQTQEKIPSPTSGEPIRLLYVPAGTRVLFHLRPAELWAPGSQGEEFRACLGPIGIWAEQKIKEICLRDPSQIKELTFCLMLGSPGAPPEYAAVVRTTEPVKRSELITQFDGQRLDDYSFPVYAGDKHSYMIVDENTYVIGPPGESRATEMAEALEYESSTSPGIESILKQTDRDRHLTVVFDPDEVRRQQDVLIPDKAHPFLNLLLNWVGDDVETVAWSMHLGQDDFYSEMTFRNTTMIRPPKLANNLKQRLDQLPHEMLEGVEKMNPGTVGSRKVIGRFPAMLKAFSMANQQQSGDRYAQLTSSLPERAAPNLALASLLTWDESTRTDFSAKAKPKPSAGPKLPDKVVDRLKHKVDVDFRRMPLQEVFAYIADETKTNIILEGEALKLVGYTKNMPQTMNMGMVSGLDAIQAIFNVKDQDQMCLVIDEAKKTATITSKPYAKQNNLKQFEFPPKN